MPHPPATTRNWGCAPLPCCTWNDVCRTLGNFPLPSGESLMLSRSSLVLLSLLLLASTPASAEPITFAFNGTIDFAGGDRWALGDPVSGLYTFDSNAARVIPSDGIGKSYDAITAFVVGVGGDTIT